MDGESNRRKMFTLLASASILVSYADRGNMASAIVPMGEAYGWGKGFEGEVLSAFFLGYALTQLIGGWLADQYGGRMTLMASLFAWSAFTLVTPLAASAGPAPLIAVRVGLGLGEGFAFPSVHAMIATDVPRESQSTIVGIVTAASYAGALVAFAVSPVLIHAQGWESVFYCFGGVSFLILPGWLLYQQKGNEIAGSVMSTPRVPTSLTEGRHEEGDKDWKLQFVREVEDLREVAKQLCARKEVWAILSAQFTQSVGMYGLLSWLPSYLHDERGLGSDSAEMAALSAAPYALQAVVGVAAGAAADALIRDQGCRVKTVRQVFQVLGMAGPAFCLAAAVSAEQAETGVSLIVLGLGMSALTLAGVSVNHLDIAPKSAGVVFGAGNTAATMAGLLTVPLCGWILETYNSWEAVFGLFTCSYVMGCVLWLAWVGDEEIE
ncbi:unnamed protein product [Choristocarpus tenellus]